jgi:PAS domain S-box-containing protein
MFSGDVLFLLVLPLRQHWVQVRPGVRQDEDIVGRGQFEVFPDNPSDPDVTGVQNLQIQTGGYRISGASLCQGLWWQVRAEERHEGGGFEERYWNPVNTPVFDENGRDRAHHPSRRKRHRFVRLGEREADQDRLQEELRVRALTMEAEVFVRTRELASVKQLVQQLRESEERFEGAFAEAPIGMVLTTPYGVILEVNQAYLEMLGYSREYLALHDSSRFTHPENVPLTRRFYERLRTGECNKCHRREALHPPQRRDPLGSRFGHDASRWRGQSHATDRDHRRHHGTQTRRG